MALPGRGLYHSPSLSQGGYPGQEANGVREINVLIIDGHAGVRAQLAQRLHAHPRFRVVAHTSNPLLGRELAWLWEPDVILIDLKATGRYSSEMCHRIAHASPGSRLVVFTSYLLNGEEQFYHEAGVSMCLLKGLSLKALAQKLCSLVGPGVT